MRRKFLALFSIALTSALFLAACVGPVGPPEYDTTAAHSEGYWYSRYNLGHLVMMSGMGVQLMPSMEMMQQMMEMAGIPDDPANPYLLQAVFSSGDPHLITEFNGNEDDLANFRWDQAQMDVTITPQAMGMADGLLNAIVEQTKAKPDFLTGMSSRDLGLALSALSAYVNYTQNDDQKQLVLKQVIPSLAVELESRMGKDVKLVAAGGYNQVATQGAAINGLLFAHKVTGNDG